MYSWVGTTSSLPGCTACQVHQVSKFGCYWCTICSTFIGRHFCLWCLAKSEDIRHPPSSSSTRAQERTTESICQDNIRFVQAGKILKHAKHFNNAICEPFFKLPLSQVRIFKVKSIFKEFNNVGVPSRLTHHPGDILSPVQPSWRQLPQVGPTGSLRRQCRLWWVDLLTVCQSSRRESCSAWTSREVIFYSY